MAGGRRQKIARSQLRERALDAAMKVAPPKIADVCVVGGGASGLACAITAAEEGASACVLEEALECGRTILATGNGRCNFTAADLAPSFYNHPDFVESAVGQDMADEVFAFFLASGMAWAADDTRCYPLSRQAASVRDVLLARAQRAGVLLLPGRGAKKLESQSKGWKVSFSGEAGEGALLASCAVLAGGGHLAEALVPQLPRIAPEPILCPLALKGLPLETLDGRRAHGRATLLREGQKIAEEAGEFLFRPYGLSGIAVFNLSRLAEPGDTLALDLAPDYAASQLSRLIRLAHTAEGVSDPRLAELLWKREGGDSDRIAQALKALSFTVEGRTDTGHAQVTRGGLAISSFASTLEADPALAGSRGLFACGEALDIDGPCGGYNLGWAWTSGMKAGTEAAKAAREIRN